MTQRKQTGQGITGVHRYLTYTKSTPISVVSITRSSHIASQRNNATRTLLYYF